MSLPRFMIAAPASGSGKTLVTCGLLQALVDRGMEVASFKCGPDYIDPMFHSRVIGTRSKNLDAYFVDEPVLRYLFGRTAETVDISVVEGVMGFYDGMTFDGTFASSNDVSNKLGIPVILLVNAKGASLSSVAVLRGFRDFAENNIRGVIFNQMSKKVFDAVAPLVRDMGIEPLGYIPKVTDLVLESRHLGLVLPGEIESLREKLHRLAGVIEESVDVDRIIEIAGNAPDLEYSSPDVGRIDGDVRIGFADDDVFCFTYEDNIEILERMGAEIVRFSPLKDERLPDVDGLILSGGYPELHGEELESNRSMLEDIRSKIGSGMPCIAECGGFMYLHETMQDRDGIDRSMCGVIPGRTWNTGKLCRFGYVTLRPIDDGGMMRSRPEIKGHEFHYWDSESNGDAWEASKRGSAYRCINDTGTLLAGYPHMYYYSNPEVPLGFLRRCAEYRDSRNRSDEYHLHQDHIEDGADPDAEEDVPLPDVQGDDRHAGDELGQSVGIGQNRCGLEAVDHQHADDRRRQDLPHVLHLGRDLLALREHQERCGTCRERGHGHHRDHDQRGCDIKHRPFPPACLSSS